MQVTSGPVVVALVALVALSMVTGCRSDDSPERAPSPASDRQTSEHDWRAALANWSFPSPIPSLSLIDHTGRRFSLSELSDSYVLVGFIFTRCAIAEACPMTTEKMDRVQRRWAALSARGATGEISLRLLALTLDPAHDTPERLAAYARARSLDLSSWTLATGPTELLQSGLPSLFNVLALPARDAQVTGDIQHTVKLALLSPGLNIAKEWKDNQFSTEDVLGTIADMADGFDLH